jgi:hypothetical protein
MEYTYMDTLVMSAEATERDTLLWDSSDLRSFGPIALLT